MTVYTEARLAAPTTEEGMPGRWGKDTTNTTAAAMPRRRRVVLPGFSPAVVRSAAPAVARLSAPESSDPTRAFPRVAMTTMASTARNSCGAPWSFPRSPNSGTRPCTEPTMAAPTSAPGRLPRPPMRAAMKAGSTWRARE
jgi:hypothetical protein